MLRHTLAAALLAAITFGSALAADHPDFSGTWKINNAKSDFGPMPTGPEKFERKVEHKDPSLKVVTTQAVNGKEVTSEASYVINGREQDVPMGSLTAKVVPQWKGDTLEVVARLEGPGGKMVSTEVWSLSEGGKVLTVAASMTMPQGEFKLKFVLEKQ